MGKILFLVIMIALAAAFVVMLLKKWGITEWMQVHGDKVSAKLFGCDFCLSFWTAVVLLVFVAAYYEDLSLLMCAICTTPITRMLV